MSDPSLSAAFRGRLGAFTLDMAFDAPLTGTTALFGPSGCGKTSVLRCMAGLTRLAGHLRINGDRWQDDAEGTFLKAHERPVGYVLQEASLFPHLSVRGNLLYGMKRAQGNGPDPGFDTVVDLLGLGTLIDRAPSALSGGERQRVAIGRALLSRPRLLLMDEPVSALDRGSKAAILPYLETVQRTLDLPMIYVSHDISEVARLADRIVVMSDGQAVASGPVDEIFERLDLRPETGRFEAGVIISATITGHDARFHLTTLDHCGQVLTIPRITGDPGEKIRLRVRARDVSLALKPPKGISIRNVLKGTIAEIVEEAETAFAETLIDTGAGRIRARVTRSAIADLGLQKGAEIFAMIKSVTFDRRTRIG